MLLIMKLFILGRLCKQTRNSLSSCSVSYRFKPYYYQSIHIFRWRLVHGWYYFVLVDYRRTPNTFLLVKISLTEDFLF